MRHVDRFGLAEADPSAFCLLPRQVACGIPARSRKSPRADAAALSGFVWTMQKSAIALPERPVTVDIGESIEVLEDGEFVLSAKTVASRLWARWYFASPQDSGFDAFYRRVLASVDSLLSSGLLVRLRGVGSGRSGSVWRLGFDGGESCPTAPAAPAAVIPLQSPRFSQASGESEADAYVNRVDSLGEAFQAESPLLYTRGIARYDVHDAGFEVDYLTWVRVVGRGAAGARYVSSGAWKRGDFDSRDTAPCLFNWITLDVDRGQDVEEAFFSARTIVEMIGLYGADLSRVVVSYTGGRGFHVRVPSGMVGGPVFRSPAHALRVLSLFAKLLTEWGEEVDKCVLLPHQPVRLPGSRHDESGLYCNAYSAKRFLAFRGVWDVIEDCRELRVFDPPDPRREIPCDELVDVMVEAAEASRPGAMPTYGAQSASRPGLASEDGDGSGSVMAAAYEGCAQAEEWHPPIGGRVFVGRDKLLFVAACGLLRESDLNTAVAMEKLREVNAKCRPPMREGSLQRRFASAVKATGAGYYQGKPR